MIVAHNLQQDDKMVHILRLLRDMDSPSIDAAIRSGRELADFAGGKPDNQAALVAAGAPEMLVAMLQPRLSLHHSYACIAMSVVGAMDSEQGARACVVAGAVPHILSLMAALDADVRWIPCFALLKLTIIPECIAAIHASPSSVKLLLQLLQLPPCSEANILASKYVGAAVHQMCTGGGDDARDALMSAGVVPALLASIDPQRPPAALQFNVISLAILAHMDDDARLLIRDAGAFEALMGLLLHATTPIKAELKMNVLKALFTISTAEDPATLVRRTRPAMSDVAALLLDDGGPLMASATEALTSLVRCYPAGAAAAIEAAGCTRRLARLMVTEGGGGMEIIDSVSPFAVIVVWNCRTAAEAYETFRDVPGFDQQTCDAILPWLGSDPIDTFVQRAHDAAVAMRQLVVSRAKGP